MHKKKVVNNIINEIIDIIKNNEPEVAVNKIAKTINPLIQEKIGKKNALKLYILYSDKSVKYDVHKYKNNINSFKDKVNENIKKAKNSVNS